VPFRLREAFEPAAQPAGFDPSNGSCAHDKAGRQMVESTQLAVLIVTHAEAVAAASDRVLELRDGRLRSATSEGAAGAS
jgi:predicted ABC-type transport system involved in lysophospholipase L1 biosynthesis ATPase subunit